MFEKPCGRPGCPNMVRKRMRCRLRQTRYCSMKCGAQHRAAEGPHPLRDMTLEERRAHGLQGAQTRIQNHRRKKLQAIGALLEKHIPRDWHLWLDEQGLARMRALMVRCYLDGREDGYQAGHTASWRAQHRKGAA